MSVSVNCRYCERIMDTVAKNQHTGKIYPLCNKHWKKEKKFSWIVEEKPQKPFISGINFGGRRISTEWIPVIDEKITIEPTPNFISTHKSVGITNKFGVHIMCENCKTYITNNLINECLNCSVINHQCDENELKGITKCQKCEQVYLIDKTLAKYLKLREG